MSSILTEILPSTHTEVEYRAIPMGYVHLIKDGQVIHKKPAAFLPRTKKVKKYKEEFNEDTGQRVVKEIVSVVPHPPAASLKEYAKDGWQRCNRDGSVILNMDGTPKKEDK